jgi:hypothetical protein
MEEAKNPTKKCTACQKEIDRKATICPYCRTKQISKPIRVISGIIIVFVIIWIFSLFSGGSKSSSVDNTPTVSSNGSSNITPSPTPVIGLNIKRSFIISEIKKVAPDIQFKEGVGQDDNYVASEGQNIIQLLGPKNNLNEISSIAFLGDDSGKNMIALVYIVGIPNIIDRDAGEWMTSAMNAAAAAKDQGETQFEKSTVIHNRKYKLSISYKDSLRYATVSIDPSN